MTECPNPSRWMRYSGGAYRLGCDCPSCRGLRSRWSAARGARAWRATQAEVDEIAVERAVRGDAPAVLTLAERRAAAAQLTAAGESAAQIAARLRVSSRTIHRYRREIAR